MTEPVRMLDPHVRTVWLIQSCVVALVAGALATGLVTAAAAAGAGWPGWTWSVPVLVVGSIIAVAKAVVPLRYRRWRFRFDDDALVLERGSLWWVGSFVPYHRIQLIDLEHGPIMRGYGLVALRLRTASAGSLARVPALSTDDAAEIRRELLRRTGRGDGA